MANPKRRFSKARTRTRRSTWKTAPASTVPCPNCKTAIRPHHVCPTCGQYRGRQVIQLASAT